MRFRKMAFPPCQCTTFTRMRRELAGEVRDNLAFITGVY